MTKLKVRRPSFDLTEPFERFWCGGDPFRTAFFNALSMSFPGGESLLITSLRHGFKALPPEQQSRFAEQIKDFNDQEAVHRGIHGQFNRHLEQQGHANRFDADFAEALRALEGKDPRHGVAMAVGSEHMTALWAEWILAYPEHLDGAEPRLRSMFLWHAAEELEHRETAFDLYQALGGTHKWRVYWTRATVRGYGLGLVRQTVVNLAHDRQLWKWKTARSATRLLLGKTGLVRTQFFAWHAAKREDYHPSRIDGSLSKSWLDQNSSLFRVITRSRKPRADGAAGATA